MNASRFSSRRRRLLAAMPMAAAGPAPAAAPDAEPIRSYPVVTSDGVRLSVMESAPDGAGPVIVLVPGWCMPASIWQAQLADLGQRFRTLAIDPRGQGDSEVPARGYEADRRARDLQEVVATVAGADARVVLVGWSLGGLEALQFVHRFGADRLAGLVLVDNSVGEPPAPKASTFIAQLRADRDAAMDRFVRSLFARPRPESQIERLKQAAQRMRLDDAIALLSYPFPREHWREIARGFSKPLCYCVTSRYLEQARNLQRERPATRVEWFEGAGHALFADEPDRFDRIVSDFAASLPA
jgi:non-heme chloroperoxidase